MAGLSHLNSEPRLKKKKKSNEKESVESFKHTSCETTHEHSCTFQINSSTKPVWQRHTFNALILFLSIYSQPKSRQICTDLKLRLAVSVPQKQFAAQTCL